MRILRSLSIYSISHALVDATCAAVAFYLLKINAVGQGQLVIFFILYNFLAFGLQTPLGLIVDKLRIPREFAIVGCLLVALSVMAVKISPWLAIYLAGIGNAVFHVGGGVVALNFDPKKASLPGIFVAPGALGLLAGTLMGKSFFTPWPLVFLLGVAAISIYFADIPEIIDVQKYPKKISNFELIIFLIFLSVVARSVIGFILVFPWKQNFDLLLILTLAVFLGKALGGIIADRLGWMRIAISSLFISALLLPFGTIYPICGFAGIFLFNMTMPITLVAISNLIPGRAGLAFGLTTIALLFGYLLTFFNPGNIYVSRYFVLIATLLLMSVLFFGLRLYSRVTKNLI